MESNTGKMELAVGSFIIAGIFIIMAMIVYMTGGVSFIDHTYKIIVRIENIGDLKKGAPVKMGGVQIGNVDSIFIGKQGVNIVAGIDPKYQLLADAKATIATAGLVGDSFLEVTKGIEGKPLPKAQTADKAAYIDGISQPGMGEIMNQVQKIGSEVQVLVGDINKIVGKEEFRRNIEETVARINKASGEAQQILAGVRKDLDKVDQAVESVAKVAESAEKTMNTVNKFVDGTIGESTQVKSINQTINNVGEITSMLNKNKDYIAGTITNLDKVTSNVARATSELSPDRGIFRLLSDDRTGQELMLTIQNLQRAANSMATVGLTDLIADKSASDEIFKLWKEEHRFSSAEQMAKEWKEWMYMQKRINNMIMQGGYPRTQPYSPYGQTSCPTGSTGSLEAYRR